MADRTDHPPTGITVVLPCAGTATRLGGLPKFMLPSRTTTPLLRAWIAAVSPWCDHIVIAVSPATEPFVMHCIAGLKDVHVRDVGITQTMNETLLRVRPLLPDPDAGIWMVMPDTALDDIVRAPTNYQADQVQLLLWKARSEQKGKAGICHGDATGLVDKDPLAPGEWVWGSVLWGPSFWRWLRADEPHVGYTLQRCASELNIVPLQQRGNYWDCGTLHEYVQYLAAAHVPTPQVLFHQWCEQSREKWADVQPEPLNIRPLVADNARQRVGLLIAVVTYARTEQLVSVNIETLNNLVLLYPDAVVAVADNGSLPTLRENLLPSIHWFDNTTHAAAGFGYEWGGYATVLEHFRPRRLIALQGTYGPVTALPSSFWNDLERRPEHQQIRALIYFGTEVYVHPAATDVRVMRQYMLAVSQRIWQQVPPVSNVRGQSDQLTGVMSNVFVCGGAVADDLYRRVFRIGMRCKLHSQSGERLLGLYMYHVGVPPHAHPIEGRLGHGTSTSVYFRKTFGNSQ